jgi:hypothetical protein
MSRRDPPRDLRSPGTPLYLNLSCWGPARAYIVRNRIITQSCIKRGSAIARRLIDFGVFVGAPRPRPLVQFIGYCWCVRKNRTWAPDGLEDTPRPHALRKGQLSYSPDALCTRRNTPPPPPPSAQVARRAASLQHTADILYRVSPRWRRPCLHAHSRRRGSVVWVVVGGWARSIHHVPNIEVLCSSQIVRPGRRASPHPSPPNRLTHLRPVVASAQV